MFSIDRWGKTGADPIGRNRTTNVLPEGVGVKAANRLLGATDHPGHLWNNLLLGKCYKILHHWSSSHWYTGFVTMWRFIKAF